MCGSLTTLNNERGNFYFNSRPTMAEAEGHIQIGIRGVPTKTSNSYFHNSIDSSEFQTLYKSFAQPVNNLTQIENINKFVSHYHFLNSSSDTSLYFT